MKQEISAAKDEGSKKSGTLDVPLLPVDNHKDTILETVRRDRVTVIHGETG